MKLNKKQITSILISSVFAGIILYFGSSSFVEFILSLNFEFSYVHVILGLVLIFSYFGSLTFIKPLVFSFSLWTKNKHVLQIITITISVLLLFAILGILEELDLEITDNDKGIIYEMVGFFIYLTPISRYIIKIIKTENEPEIDYSGIIIKTTAISLVLIGLFLQFSFFT